MLVTACPSHLTMPSRQPHDPNISLSTNRKRKPPLHILKCSKHICKIKGDSHYHQHSPRTMANNNNSNTCHLHHGQIVSTRVKMIN